MKKIHIAILILMFVMVILLVIWNIKAEKILRLFGRLYSASAPYICYGSFMSRFRYLGVLERVFSFKPVEVKYCKGINVRVAYENIKDCRVQCAALVAFLKKEENVCKEAFELAPPYPIDSFRSQLCIKLVKILKGEEWYPPEEVPPLLDIIARKLK